MTLTNLVLTPHYSDISSKNSSIYLNITFVEVFLGKLSKQDQKSIDAIRDSCNKCYRYLDFYMWNKSQIWIYIQMNILFSIYRVSQKKIVFRNLVLFWLAGVWAFKIWVILGSKNIHAITRCLALVPNVSTLVCTPLSLYTPLNGHLIRGFAIFLKTISFWDTL